MLNIGKEVIETGKEKDLGFGHCPQSFIIFQGEIPGKETDTDHDHQVLDQDLDGLLHLHLHLLDMRKGERAEVDMMMKRGSDMMIIIVRQDIERAAVAITVITITPIMKLHPFPRARVR